MSNEKEIVKALLMQAPYAKNMMGLCSLVGISRQTLYRYFRTNVTLKADIVTLLGAFKKKSVTAKKKKVSRKKAQLSRTKDAVVGHTESTTKHAPEGTAAKDSDIDIKKHSNNRYDGRIATTKQICNLMRRGSTLVEACTVMGITGADVADWQYPAHPQYTEEVAMLVRDTLISVAQAAEAEIKLLSLRVLQNAMTVTTHKSVTKYGRINKHGEVTPTAITEHTREEKPTVQAAIFALKTLDAAKFGDTKEREKAIAALDSGGDPEEIKQMSLEDLDAEILRLRALNRMEGLDDA